MPINIIKHRPMEINPRKKSLQAALENKRRLQPVKHRVININTGDDEENNPRLHDFLPKQPTSQWESTKLVPTQALTNIEVSFRYGCFPECFCGTWVYLVFVEDTVFTAGSDQEFGFYWYLHWVSDCFVDL